MNCPSCKTEFTEKRDKAFLCKNCGWLMEVDGKWITIPEPPKVTEKISVKPAPPVTDKEPDNVPISIDDPNAIELNSQHIDSDRHTVKSYLGGIITITEIKEDA